MCVPLKKKPKPCCEKKENCCLASAEPDLGELACIATQCASKELNIKRPKPSKQPVLTKSLRDRLHC